jgi:hypothetical protein
MQQQEKKRIQQQAKVANEKKKVPSDLTTIYIEAGSPWGEDLEIDRLCDWAAEYIRELQDTLD